MQEARFVLVFFLDADCDAGRQETIGMSFKKKEKKEKVNNCICLGGEEEHICDSIGSVIEK